MKYLFLKLIRACALKCEKNHKDLIVHQIGPEKFAIINAKPDLIINDLGTHEKYPLSIQENWPGIKLLTVPCDHQIEQTTETGQVEILIPAGLPCLKFDTTKLEIEHYLPIVWANVGDMEIQGGFQQTFSFRNITTAYNRHWADSVPYFTTVTPTRDIEKRLADIEIYIPTMDGSNTYNWIHVILLGWCGLLSFLLGVIILVWIRTVCTTNAVTQDFGQILADIQNKRHS